jgi:CRP-like cAMP-binding protein
VARKRFIFKILSEILFVSPLEKAIAGISLLSAESGNAFLNAWQYWPTPKDHLLLREHSVSDYFYFIQKGVARIYYYKNDKEITEWIAMDEQFFLSITSFFQRTPSHLIIQTIEPSEVYGIHHSDFMTLADKYHDVEKLLRKMVTRSLIMSQVRMDSIQFETAQQRYERLLKNSPNIIQRVPLSYIASFLGVTLETLSRIRSQK